MFSLVYHKKIIHGSKAGLQNILTFILKDIILKYPKILSGNTCSKMNLQAEFEPVCMKPNIFRDKFSSWNLKACCARKIYRYSMPSNSMAKKICNKVCH